MDIRVRRPDMGIWYRSVREWVNGLNAVDPESIKGKLLVNFIDKMVLGVLAAIVVCCAQNEYLENKKFKEIAFEKTKIQTELIVAHQQELTQSVASFIGLIFEKDVLSIGRLENEVDQDALRKFLKDIRVAVFYLQVLNEKLNKQGEALVGTASAIYMDVISGGVKKEGINKKLNTLQTSYGDLLKEVRQTIRDVLKREYEGSNS
jgi:hypothetical protein